MRAATIFCLLLLLAIAAQAAPKPIPVLFDTDIGTDIDDAYALALFVHRPDFAVVRRDHRIGRRGGAGAPRGETPRDRRWQVGRGLRSMRVVDADAVHEAGRVGRGFPVTEPARIRRDRVHAPHDRTRARAKSPSLPSVSSRTSRRCSIPIRPREEDPGDCAHGWRHLPRLCARLEARARVEHSARTRKRRAAYSRPACHCWSRRSIPPRTSSSRPRCVCGSSRRGTPLNDALGALDQIWRYTNHWKGDQPTLFDVLPIELVSSSTAYELSRCTSK